MTEYIEEEISLFEFSERFLLNNDFHEDTVYNVEDLDIEVETVDRDGNLCYRKILNYFVKNTVDEYYTNGDINVSPKHRFIIGGEIKLPHELPEFYKVNGTIPIVDIEVEDLHSFLANGYLHHNSVSGGQAIPFTASTRLRLKKLGQLKGKINGVDAVIGETIEVAIVKNRLGPPKRKVKFDIRYDSGIDNYGSWLTMLKELGAIGQSGSSYSYKYVDGDTGEEITKKFQSKDFRRLLEETPGLKEVIYDQICEVYIMKYDLGEEELGIDDVVLVTENDEEI